MSGEHLSEDVHHGGPSHRTEDVAGDQQPGAVVEDVEGRLLPVIRGVNYVARQPSTMSWNQTLHLSPPDEVDDAVSTSR